MCAYYGKGEFCAVRRESICGGMLIFSRHSLGLVPGSMYLSWRRMSEEAQQGSSSGDGKLGRKTGVSEYYIEFRPVLVINSSDTK